MSLWSSPDYWISQRFLLASFGKLEKQQEKNQTRFWNISKYSKSYFLSTKKLFLLKWRYFFWKKFSSQTFRKSVYNVNAGKLILFFKYNIIIPTENIPLNGRHLNFTFLLFQTYLGTVTSEFNKTLFISFTVTFKGLFSGPILKFYSMNALWTTTTCNNDHLSLRTIIFSPQEQLLRSGLKAFWVRLKQLRKLFLLENCTAKCFQRIQIFDDFLFLELFLQSWWRVLWK